MADLTLVAADIRPLPGAMVVRMKAGSGGLTVGQAVYISADDTVLAADADVDASAQVFGVVVSSTVEGVTTVAAGSWCDVLVFGQVTGFYGMTAGDMAYASITAGALADAPPAGSSSDYTWTVGHVINATTILINPFTDNYAAL